MTNQESLQNIEIVKKLAHLYDNDCVYLKFKNKIEFEIIRLPKLDDDFHSIFLKNLHEHSLPYGHMWQPPLRSEPHLRYIDSNLNFLLNLTTLEYTLDFNDAPVDIEEARKEYLDLIRQLK